MSTDDQMRFPDLRGKTRSFAIRKDVAYDEALKRWVSTPVRIYRGPQAMEVNSKWK